jgi:hypothetical protein
MAKKTKKAEAPPVQIEEPTVVPVFEEVETEPAKPDLVIEPATVSTPALPDKMVQVRNQGALFLCDLTAYGYGLRWPTNAVYTIPTSVYIGLLKKGLNGVSA